MDFVEPLAYTCTIGNQTPLDKNPGCGDTPGTTGMPVKKAGGGAGVTGTKCSQNINIIKH